MLRHDLFTSSTDSELSMGRGRGKDSQNLSKLHNFIHSRCFHASSSSEDPVAVTLAVLGLLHTINISLHSKQHASKISNRPITLRAELETVCTGLLTHYNTKPDQSGPGLLMYIFKISVGVRQCKPWPTSYYVTMTLNSTLFNRLVLH